MQCATAMQHILQLALFKMKVLDSIYCPTAVQFGYLLSGLLSSSNIDVDIDVLHKPVMQCKILEHRTVEYIT